MARASNIYLVEFFNNSIAAFTVKWEAQEWLEKFQVSNSLSKEGFLVKRFPDGRYIGGDRQYKQSWFFDEFVNE